MKVSYPTPSEWHDKQSRVWKKILARKGSDVSVEIREARYCREAGKRLQCEATATSKFNRPAFLGPDIRFHSHFFRRPYELRKWKSRGILIYSGSVFTLSCVYSK